MAGDEAFTSWLKQRRKALDFTQAELGREVGCSVYTIQRIEEGVLRPSRQLAELLAAALEIAPGERQEFVRRARAATGEKAVAPSAAAPVTADQLLNPYKGLRAFQEADAADFFGRESLTKRLCARFAEADPLARFLAVVGPSGAGKSSVARAGLIPALRDSLGSGATAPVVVDITPGARPFEELEAGLLRVAVNPPGSLMEQLRADERGLARAVKRVLPADDNSELLLLIDQFEELFTLAADEALRRDLLSSIFSAISDPRSRLRIVVTLRADFYDRPLLYLPSSELLGRRTEVVGPLTADEMYRAITGPAQRNGLELENSLVVALMQDVAEQPGALPLLEYTLSELFERREGRVMTLAGYRASGGVFGSLAQRAENLYASLAPTEQREARQILLRLVSLGEGAEDTRRRVPMSELLSATRNEDALHRTLDLFGRYRMLTFDRDPLNHEPTVEVAHEALLRNWGRLSGWLSESRERLLAQRRLMITAGEWQAAQQEASFLASGARLEQFASLAGEDGGANTLALTTAEQLYLDASLAEQRRRAASEQNRQQRELALQQHAASRLRYLLVGLTLFLLLASVLAAWALIERGAAQASEQVAQSNLTHVGALRLAAEANTLFLAHGDPNLIALLSISSLNSQYSPQGDAALAAAATLIYPAREFRGHSDAVVEAAFSPNGLYLATGSNDSTARLWDVASGQQIRVFSGHTATVGSVAFSPDGKSLLTGSDDKSVRLWDVASGQQLKVFTQDSLVWDLAVSRDGGRVFASALDGSARLWDLNSGQLLFTVQGRHGFLTGTAFSPDGKFVVAGQGEGDGALLWDAATGKQLRLFAEPGGVDNVAFTPDGKYLAASSDDHSVRLYDVASGQQIRQFDGHQNWVQGIAVSPDGKYLLSGSDDKTARLWDINTGDTLHIFSGHTAPIYGVTFAPDGKSIATASSDGTARLWNTQASPGEQRFIGHSDAVWQSSFSPDGKRIVSASNDYSARIWDVATGLALVTLSGHTYNVRGAVFSPDGKTVLTASGDRTARLWDATTGQEIMRFSGHNDAVIQAVFSPDGKTVVTASDDGTARVWDSATGKPLVVFAQHSGHVNGVAFAPNGLAVATTGDDGATRIWDSASGVQLQLFNQGVPVTGVTFSPDGKWLLSAGADGAARLWDVASGKELRRFNGHVGAVYGVAFSPDGRFALTSGADQTARLWDAQTGQELRRFSGHSGEIRSVGFSPDNRFVLTASHDNTVRLWYADYHDTITALCSQLNRDFTAAERRRYEITDPGPTCPIR